MLLASRRHLRRIRTRSRLAFVEGSLEALPFRARTFERIAALGVLGFVGRDLPAVLRRLAGLLRPDGTIVLEVQTPSQATMTLLPRSPRASLAILRKPEKYHLWSVVRDGYQPFDPARFARFEFTWRRPADLRAEVRRAGLRIVDQMALAPVFGNQAEFLAKLRRGSAAYATALKLEEEAGRWPELWGAGAGLLVAAAPSSTRSRH